MSEKNRHHKSIKPVCLIIVIFVVFHANAQVELPTFFFDGEEYEAMPFDENGSPTWWEATERCTYKQAYGYSDWFVPDIDQLRALYAHQNAIGGFTDNWYWSSTQNNQYSSVVLNFKNCQSYPEGNDSRASKCRYIRKTGRTKKTQDDYRWIYGEWIGKYQYYTSMWKEAYMVVSITPDHIVITDGGVQIYKGKYVIKDGLIEYIPYHNNLGWIGSDEWGFIEIMPETHQLGSGYNKVLDKSKSYNYTTPPPQANKRNAKDANITIKALGCEIFIDGKAVGNERWIGILEKGRHIVKVAMDCYEPYEKTIEVVGGKDETYTITPLQLKKRNLKVTCDADNATVVIDGMEMEFEQNRSLFLDLELKKTHKLTISAPKHVPITLSFSILEDRVICEKQEGLSSYSGEQSALVKFDLDEMDIHLNKLNKRLYHGDDYKYERSGPVMGVDRIRINGFTIGSEMAWHKEYYTRSRVMISGSLGLAITPESLSSMSDLEETPPDCFVGVGVGWQIFKGTGIRVTPQIEGAGSLIEPRATLFAKINVAYPITDRFVIGIAPKMSLVSSADIGTPYADRNTYYGVSLYLGWQKR